MWQLILITMIGATGFEVEVTPIDGEVVEGELTGLSTETVTVKVEDADLMFPVRDLLAVASVYGQPSEAKPEIWVELVDGSRIAASDYRAKSSQATIKLCAGGEVEVGTRSIHTVLLKPQHNLPKLQEAWKKIQLDKNVGDVLVIRKEVEVVEEDGLESSTRKELVLNPAQGILFDVDEKTIEFDFDGDRFPVGRQKVEGLIYYHAAGRRLSRPVCRIEDYDGSIWNVKSMEQTADGIDLVTVAGAKASLGFDQIAKFDFAAGNLDFLSDLEWAYLEVKRPLQFVKTSAVMDRQYHPQRDKNYGRLGENRLRLLVDGQKYDKGLALRSNTSVVYNLPEGSRRFIAKAGIDHQGNQASHVMLVIKGDSETLLETPISGVDEEPLVIDVDVTGFKRLKIEVEPGRKPDHWDFLDLINARITR